jgi:tetratricopeptide (TPR) repeat protein
MPAVSVRPDRIEPITQSGKASGRRGRRRGVEIRPGSVKQARREAGLSLGQVAGREISRTAIYFVETGKAKPSMETLRLIAERTGRPLEFFLSLHEAPPARSMTTLSEIERLVATGDNAAAAAVGEDALGDEQDAETAARIRFLMSTAYLRLAQPVVARQLASSARAYFEGVNDPLMIAECLGNEATAAYAIEDPGAIRLAEGALSTARTLKPVPQLTESRLLSVLGNAHLANQDWQAAIERYEQAIAAAEVVQDLRRLSLLYSGLSVAYQELEQFEQAGHFAHKALVIHETLNDRISLARSENNLGVLLLRAGDLTAAGPHLDRSLAMCEELGIEAGRANVFHSLSELWLAKRDLVLAEKYARDGLALAQRLSEFGAVAESHFWLAKVAEAKGDEVTVDEEFDAVFDAMTQQPRRGRAARYHAMYAEILEARGDLAGANHHLRRALAASGPAPSTLDSRTAIA